jgi:hypothetical protein
MVGLTPEEEQPPMDHDLAALQDRVRVLELELETVRTPPRPVGAVAWWDRHGRRVLFTLTLLAFSAPTAVWMQGRHEERMLAKQHKHETKLQYSEAVLRHRHERVLSYLDAALHPDTRRPEREAALRYLAENLSRNGKTRTWAAAELKRLRNSCGQ